MTQTWQIFLGEVACRRFFPFEGSSSGDSSPKIHKQAASHRDSGGQLSDLPCNTRSVNNRALKAQLKENVDKNME